MNTKLMLSKKFRAAVMAAISSLLTFAVSKFGLDLDVSETMMVITAVTSPFLIYIGAEGVSEMSAKAVIEENKSRTELADRVLLEVLKNGEEQK